MALVRVDPGRATHLDLHPVLQRDAVAAADVLLQAQRDRTDVYQVEIDQLKGTGPTFIKLRSTNPPGHSVDGRVIDWCHFASVLLTGYG